MQVPIAIQQPPIPNPVYNQQQPPAMQIRPQQMPIQAPSHEYTDSESSSSSLLSETGQTSLSARNQFNNSGNIQNANVMKNLE
jgi:hypothetical protein